MPNLPVIDLDGGTVTTASQKWKYTATNYTDLLTKTGMIEGDLAIVYSSQGTWLINRKLRGVYMYVSGVWVYANQELQDQIQATDELKEILAIGNVMADGQTIEAENGDGLLNLRNGANDNVLLETKKSFIKLQEGYYESTAGDFLTDPSYSQLLMQGNSAIMAVIKSNFTKFGWVVIADNDIIDLVTGSLPNYPVALGSQGSKVLIGVINTTINGGINIIAKTNNSTYANMNIYHKSNEDYETVINHITPTEDRTQSHQNRNGKIGIQPVFTFVKGELSRVGQTTIALMNQQANIPEEYIKADFTPFETDNYKISISFVWSLNTAANNFLATLTITDGVTPIVIPFLIEPKDSGGTGVVVNVVENGLIIGNDNTGTDIRTPLNFDFILPLVSGTLYSGKLSFGSDTANTEATIYQAQISVEQKTINI